MKDYELDAAKRALNYAKNVQKNKSEYKSLCKSFPAMVSTNGLAQSVLFCESKGRDEHKYLLKNLENEYKLFTGNDSSGELSKALLKMNLRKYMEFEKFILTMMKWLRRYVDVYIEKE